MNLRQLRYFVGVIDAGNMTRAAEQLHVAQTALGTQIRLVEEDLGVALLMRHSRGVAPTRAGELLYARARAILTLVEETRREVAGLGQDEPETIRLGITPALMLAVGTEVTVTAREQVPGLSLSMVEAMSHVLIGALPRGECDYILCYDVPDLPGVHRTALLQDDLVLVTRPGPLAGRPVPLAEALDETLAMPEAGDSVRTAVARAAGDLGLRLQVAFEVRSIPAMKGLVQRGVAASILPYASVLEEVRGGTLQARPIVMPSVRRTLFLARASQAGPFRHDAALRTIIDAAITSLLSALGPLGQALSAEGNGVARSDQRGGQASSVSPDRTDT